MIEHIFKSAFVGLSYK